MARSAILRLDDPIGRKSVSELVVQRILDMVKAGSLAPGHKLPAERDLAQQLNVSRPTVREALRALAILGVVEIRHGGGVYVTSLDAELLSPMEFFVTLSASNMAELFDARIQFEPMIARMAAERLTDDQLARLAALVAQQVAAPDDAELFHDTDVEFHKTILDASGNAFLSRFGKMLQVLGDQGRKAFQKRRSIRAQSVLDHQAILAALTARDPDGAHRAMRQHMVNVRNALKEVTGA